MKALMARFATPRSDAGFALIEVIVSAAVLAMISLAVLAGLDGATSSTGRESARAVASSLAEQDQERLRSMTIDPVANYGSQTRTVTVNGAEYTIRSTTRWVKDDTGQAPSCASGASESDYVSITSAVTSNVVGTRIAPVTVQSLYSPPVKYRSGTGTLAVQMSNRDGAGVPNLTVHIAGTTSGTVSRDAPTNSTGCALFQYVPAGSYAVSATRPGWVDRGGHPTASQTTTLVAGTVGLVAMDYDQAASATLTVKTFSPGTTTPLDSTSADASEINPGDPAMRTFAAGANPAHTVPATGLFPFKDAYTFWTGSCSGENPAGYNSAYFTGPGNHALPTDAGRTYTLDVFQPPLNLRVTRDANSKLIGNGSGDRMTYTATYTEPGCTDQVNLYPVTRTVGGATQYAWLSTQSSTFDPGLPFGKWTICVSDATKRRHITLANYDNTAPGGQGTTVDLAPLGSSNYSSGTSC
jgi:type II secretory pathway pseudopilin PulG